MKKYCPKCKETKLISEFYFRKDQGKHRNECKECIKQKTHQYRKENREVVRETERRYYKNNKIEINQKRKREYYIKNKEKNKQKKIESNNKKSILFKNVIVLEQETFEKFGYYPSKLSYGSKRKVVWKCSKCGKIGIRIFRDCRTVCQNCYLSRIPLNKKKKYINKRISKNYCCMECGGFVSSQCATDGSGLCKKCYSEFLKSKQTIVYCKICGEKTCGRSQSRLCSQCYRESLVGKKNPNWNGNLSNKDRKKHRKTNKVKIYVKTILNFFDYKCIKCNINSPKLHVHHLEGHHWCKNLRYSVYNGVPLCKECHKEFHSKYGIIWNTSEQFLEFLNER